MSTNLRHILLFSNDGISGLHSGCSTPRSQDDLRLQYETDRARGREMCVKHIETLTEADRQDWKKILLPHVLAIIEKFHEILGHRQFTVHFNAQPRSGKAQPGGDIFLDYRLLTTADIAIVQTLGHEWGHLALGHVANPHVKTTRKISVDQAEQEADFYSGMVLSLMGYIQKEVSTLLDDRSSTATNHGSYHSDYEKRGPFIAAGFRYGSTLMKENTLKKKPALDMVAFDAAFQRASSSTMSPRRVRRADKWF